MSEWDKRELCPDGGCVGVLIDDGTCSVCGKRGRAAGTAAAVSTAADSGGARRGDETTDFDEDDEYYYDDGDDDDSDEDDGDDDDDDDESDADVDEDGVASVGWTDRRLCPDGGCIGVIGDNGTCKVCGKPGATST